MVFCYWQFEIYFRRIVDRKFRPRFDETSILVIKQNGFVKRTTSSCGRTWAEDDDENKMVAVKFNFRRHDLLKNLSSNWICKQSGYNYQHLEIATIPQ